jgi:hypothetical protein
MTTTIAKPAYIGPITSANLVRWSGLAAIAGGLIFAGIQPIHPPDYLASVTTGTWATFMGIKLAMCLFFLIGLTGIYARQASRAGWIGLAGFALLIVSWFLQTGFVFTEGVVLPVLAGPAPQFVEGFLTIANGTQPTVDIGATPVLYGVVGICYMLGGLLFGIASVRAGVLARWPAILLAVVSVLTPLAALLPHEMQRLAGIPVGVAIAWLGYSVWSAREAAGRVIAGAGLTQTAR